MISNVGWLHGHRHEPVTLSKTFGPGMGTDAVLATETITKTATSTKANRHPSRPAARAPITSGATIPPTLIVTSPSASATARRSPWTSASKAHNDTSADVPKKLTRNAAAMVTEAAFPYPSSTVNIAAASNPPRIVTARPGPRCVPASTLATPPPIA